MPGYFVFVRFFFGYSNSFPFEQFANVKDGDLVRVAEAFGKRWWSKPANRRRLQTARAKWVREWKKRRKEQEAKVREWKQGELAGPGVNWLLPDTERSKAPPKPKAPTVRTGAPNFQEIANLEGWRVPHGFILDWLHDISNRYPVAHFNRKGLAVAAAAALQDRVVELAKATWGKQPWSDGDDLLALLNPRFSVVVDRELSRAESATATEQLQRINGPVSANPTSEEGFLRFYWPLIRPTMEQFDHSLPTKGGGGERVVLRGRDEGPLLLGKPKRKLTTPRYNVVKALLDAGDVGLTKDELVTESGHEDARGILTRLAESDADWRKVIHFAGVTGGRYRIK
jgi:hypothetical protein